MGNIIPHFQEWTAEQIAQDNARVNSKPIQGDVPVFTAPKAEQRIATLKERMAQKLKTYPMPDVDVSQEQPEEKPVCAMCGGTGTIKYAVPRDHALFGKLVKCPAPDCPGVQHNEQQRHASFREREIRHYGDKIEYVQHASMEHYPEDDTRRAVQAARVFLENGQVVWNGDTKRSLVFFGEVGRGKSYLISAMRNHLWQQHRQLSQFRKIRTMLKAVQKGYSATAEMRDYEVEDMLSTTKYLFIDEFETGFVSGDRTDILESIIDHRYREDLPVIIATNADQNKIWHIWGDRIPSRLIHMAHWIEMSGDTLRNTNPAIRDRK